MNATLLVDAIVRQTVILIATLATGAGQRPSLSHIADQVFADLVRELKEQGLSNKLIADMFGIALRTYHTRVAQLAESRSDQGRSLWEAVYSHIQERGQVARAAVLARFRNDDSAMVRAVLRDLVESGLVFSSGRAEATIYRARDGHEGADLAQDAEARQRMLLVAIHRHGPITGADLAELVPAEGTEALPAALAELVARGLVSVDLEGDERRYGCERCVIPFGDEAGWEAAVFDHFQAMVSALVTKLRSGARRADLADRTGGSTFVFDLHEGHPMQSEVLGYLEVMRVHGLALRRRLDAHEATHPAPPGARSLRVVAYVGQTVVEQDEEGGGHGADA